jgi:sugar transferase (PEP-CTERM/EpsH1 system associated)
MLTQRLPFAPNRGDRLRAFQQILKLQAAGWAVDLLALVHDDDEARQVGGMRRPGLRVEIARVPHLRNRVRGLVSLPGDTPLTLSLLRSPGAAPALERMLAGGRPDVVLACSSSMAALALQPPLADIPLVIDFVDVDSVKWDALSRRSSWPLSWIYRREHRTLTAFEAIAARRAFSSVVVTDREVAALRAFAPDVRAETIPNGIDLQRFGRPADARSDPQVVFTGVMNYEPNADGAVWLGREIWPLVRRTHPDARLEIVGSSPTAAVRDLQSDALGIDVTGSVPDVCPYLWNARVAVAPLRVARGIQNKVLEAAAAGLPCVVTPAVRDGLPASLQALCPVAESSQAFADAIARQLESPVPADVMVSSVSALDWAATLERLPLLLVEAAAAHRSANASQ